MPQEIDTLRKLALSYPETEEGTTCDKSAFKVRGKSFLFVGTGGAVLTVMLKLGPSLAEAESLAAKRPANCKVGNTGWVTLTLAAGESLPPKLLEKWVAESFRLLAPKQVVALLPSGSKDRKTNIAAKVISPTKDRTKKRAQSH
jgi:hypothetical protein